MPNTEAKDRSVEDRSVEERPIVEQLALSYPDNYTLTREPLSERSMLQLERVKCPEIGMGAAVVRVGRRYAKKELDEEIREEFGDEFVVGEIGFKEIWRVPPEYEFEDIYRDEMIAIRTLASSTLELNGWEPEEVEALYFAGSPIIPPYYTDGMAKEILLNYGDVIANATGLDHLIEKEMTFCCFAACNSGGHGAKKLLTESRFKGRKALLLVYEGITKQLPGFDKEKADFLSHYFFSDGGAAFGVIADETLTYLVGESGAWEDREGLRVLEPWRLLIDDREGPLVQTKGRTTFVRLNQPPGGMIILMEGGTVTKRILRNVFPPIKRVNEIHAKLYPQKMRFRIPHVASLKVVEGLERFSGAQLDNMVDDGNSSGATMPINLARHLPLLESGDHAMLVSFGAGLSWDISAIKVGPRKKGETPIEIRTKVGPIDVYDSRVDQVP